MTRRLSRDSLAQLARLGDNLARFKWDVLDLVGDRESLKRPHGEERRMWGGPYSREGSRQEIEASGIELITSAQGWSHGGVPYLIMVVGIHVS